MKNQKTLTNKGFSLVELIIVVAIMAILIGVLAPQYLRYVEKSRLQKDNTSIGEIADIIKMQSADEKLVEYYSTAVTFTFDSSSGEFQGATGGGSGTGAITAINDDLKLTLGTLSDTKLTSNTYKNLGATFTITAGVDSNNVMTVTTTNWIGAPGESAGNKTF